MLSFGFVAQKRHIFARNRVFTHFASMPYCCVLAVTERTPKIAE